MNVGFRHRLDREIEAWAHGNLLLFFRFYGNFQSMAELRCTPREYGLLPILRAVNDALPDESLAVGNFANNADADRGFFEQKGGASHRAKKQEDFEKYDHRY